MHVTFQAIKLEAGDSVSITLPSGAVVSVGIPTHSHASHEIEVHTNDNERGFKIQDNGNLHEVELD